MERLVKVVSIDEEFEKGRGPDKQKRKSRMKDPFYRHQFAIAKRTLSMTPAMANVMGGMTIDEATKFMERHQQMEKVSRDYKKHGDRS